MTWKSFEAARVRLALSRCGQTWARYTLLSLFPLLLFLLFVLFHSSSSSSYSLSCSSCSSASQSGPGQMPLTQGCPLTIGSAAGLDAGLGPERPLRLIGVQGPGRGVSWGLGAEAEAGPSAHIPANSRAARTTLSFSKTSFPSPRVAALISPLRKDLKYVAIRRSDTTPAPSNAASTFPKVIKINAADNRPVFLDVPSGPLLRYNFTCDGLSGLR